VNGIALYEAALDLGCVINPEQAAPIEPRHGSLSL